MPTRADGRGARRVIGTSIRICMVQDRRRPSALAVDNRREQPAEWRQQMAAQIRAAQSPPARKHALNVMNGWSPVETHRRRRKLLE
jgi:hypothetical protein